MKELFRKKKFFIITLVLLVTALTFVYFNVPNIVHKNQINVVDPNNDQALVGFANNVFVGEVKRKAGTVKLSGFPETQYEVEVIYNIKGEAYRTVIVNHEIGYKGWHFVMNEGDRLLEIGKTYLFVTRLNREEAWYTLVPVYGNLVISSEEEKETLIKRFTKAYQEQIPFR